jgi:UDP-glucose 4-epimerase
MNILVVGGCGYIGSHACKALASMGHNVINLDNLSRGHREFARWGQFYEGDLGDSALLDRIFAACAVDVVMHFAAFAYVGESVSKPDLYYINNIQKPLVLLEAMRKHSVKNFIFSSTCASYGELPPESIPVGESHVQAPVNPYGRSKYFFEQILKDYDHAYGIKSIFFRYFNAAGADPDCEVGEWHDPETHLIPLIFQAAIGVAPPLTVFGSDYEIPGGNGDGTAVRDYIHIVDLVQAHVRGIDYLKKFNKTEAFNLGNGRGFSVLEVIHAAQRICGLKVPYTLGPRRPGDPPILVGSAEKARGLLGWKPEFPELDQILSTAWAWEKKLRNV